MELRLEVKMDYNADVAVNLLAVFIAPWIPE